ncbi:MAG: hypothetical protein K8S13_06625 [Desulfobacula sp.]|uniref:hypothetical protein n=1 Tax=Desulfobacula sp. TaxID=2593537 RepID=UPI0025BDCA87|nr:hypothetical protein [Desulfobacula sp.]MCD4719520.1 hypothetical protein [Desulfobacula sp.]
MKMTVDGFDFEFEDAIDAFVFDEKDKHLPNYHGVSHAMKAVDLIVELANDYLFIEVKDFHDPDEYQDGDYFNHLRESLKYKYRDTFLYRWAENKIDKPIRYLCLLTLDNALITRMNKEIKKQLPVGRAISRWEQSIAKSSVVVNIERWNNNFPKWSVRRS